MKSIFKTDKKEDFHSRILRFILNFFPAYRKTGARVVFISSDWQEVHIKQWLRLGTRNYVGTVFGGSIYGALDPIYMVQLIRILGDKYVVWDKSAEIKFIRPISKKVYARFLIENELIENIKATIAAQNEMELELSVYFEDEQGKKYAQAIKKLYIADKNFYQQKKKKSAESKR